MTFNYCEYVMWYMMWKSMSKSFAWIDWLRVERWWLLPHQWAHALSKGIERQNEREKKKTQIKRQIEQFESVHINRNEFWFMMNDVAECVRVWFILHISIHFVAHSSMHIMNIKIYNINKRRSRELSSWMSLCLDNWKVQREDFGEATWDAE